MEQEGREVPEREWKSKTFNGHMPTAHKECKYCVLQTCPNKK